jgi:hypothetical protein
MSEETKSKEYLKECQEIIVNMNQLLGEMREKISQVRNEIEEAKNGNDVSGQLDFIEKIKKEAKEATDALNTRLVDDMSDSLKKMRKIVDSNFKNILQGDFTKFKSDLLTQIQNISSDMQTQIFKHALIGGFGNDKDGGKIGGFLGMAMPDKLQDFFSSSKKTEDGQYSILNMFKSTLGGLMEGRAIGGHVERKPYMVGENGPELFMPASAGNIVPNHRLNKNDINMKIYVNSQAEADHFKKNKSQVMATAMAQLQHKIRRNG